MAELNAERQYRYGRKDWGDLVLECERLRSALAFYANENNYPHQECAQDDLWCDVLGDRGDTAKRALGVVEQNAPKNTVWDDAKVDQDVLRQRVTNFKLK